jgi:pyruvate/2-oxoglutarate dehydrogenase complex dihydrolipoamide dehydrogenase (E3) component
VSVDLSVVQQRKRSIVESWQAGSRSSIESVEGVDLLMGEARFRGPKTITVQMNDGTQRELRAEQIFLNVGTRNAQPPIDGLDSVPALDSTSIMELDVVPEHLIVLGGGYIGMEFSQMFRRFGSGVTVIQRGPQLLPREDADIGAEVANILRDDGITVLINTEAQHVEQAADGGIILTAQSSAGEHTVRGSHLLVATGRRPNTDLLNVEAAGLETDKKGTLTVNDRLETNVPGIYAMGDVKGGPAFTHISYDDFRVVKTNVLDGGSASIAGRMVPYTVFIDPQLGRIGLTEQQAREQGYNIRVAKLPMSSVARAIEVDETRGMMKAVVDADSEQILGAAILGLEGGEVVNVLQVAMMGQLPYTALRDGVLPHPTLSESLNNLFTTLEEG